MFERLNKAKEAAVERRGDLSEPGLYHLIGRGGGGGPGTGRCPSVGIPCPVRSAS